MKITIGIDPDSKAHGVAIYEDGKLEALVNWQLMEIYDFLRDLKFKNVEFIIEDVKKNKGTFKKGYTKNKDAEKGIAQSVGKCKQAQIELERMLDYFNVPYRNFPISKMWKSQAGKKQFELATGWKGRSNEDNRSAAYFGFVGCK